MKLLDPIRWIDSFKCEFYFMITLEITYFRDFPIFASIHFEVVQPLRFFREWPKW
jgi:hypothetical protein